MRSVFINLLVADLARSRAFWSALGFGFNEQFSDAEGACLVIEPNIYAMLLTPAKFGGFVAGPVGDPQAATSALYALSAESREAVSELKAKAMAAGAGAWKPDLDMGFMFGASFRDPDGHVWEAFWMDPAAIAGGPPGEAG